MQLVNAQKLDDSCLSDAEAATLAGFIAQGLAQEPLWHAIRKHILTPQHPAGLHCRLRDMAYASWNENVQGPRPIWRAEPERLARTNLAAIMHEKGFKTYDEMYQWSVRHGREFWEMMVTRLGIAFMTPHAGIVDTSNPRAARWFPGATMNIASACFNASRDAVAVIYQKEGSEELIRYSYAELDAMSNKVAGALVREGFQPRDRIAIDMPFNIEAVAIFLGILKMGGSAVALADSFKAMDIDIRLEAAQPVKAIFTQDVTGGARAFALYPVVASASLCPRAIVATSDGAPFTPLREGDISFADFLGGVSSHFEPVAMDTECFINIIFSSSTSSPKEKEGEKPKPPKAIPWRPATALESVIEAHLHHDMQPGKVLCWPTNLGWMMGSFAIFAALINRGTLAIFDGSATCAQFCKFVERAGVNVLGLVPTLAEAWERQNLTQGCDWSKIEAFSSSGSPSNPDNYFWLMGRVPGYAPCIEYMGGTEIGGGYLTWSYFHPAAPSCFSTPSLGTDIYLWPQDDGKARKDEVFIVMRNSPGECPPMGLSTSLLNFDHEQKYFERGLQSPDGYMLREHGDLVQRCANGFYISAGRADDGMNINGIKTSSLDIENYIKEARIDGLNACAAVGVRPPEGGEDWLVIYAVTEPGSAATAESLKAAIREAIKRNNPQLARVHDVVLLTSLPYTATNKLRRRFLQDSYLENHAPGAKRTTHL